MPKLESYIYHKEDAGVIYCGDCLEILPLLPDNSVDLVLTDPPYGIERFSKGSLRFDKKGEFVNGIPWDIKPTKKQLDIIIGIALQSIIWGFNNLELPCSEHFLVWDKQQTVPNFASAEIAWTNIKLPAKVYKQSIHSHNNDKAGGHPTEKPLKLMKWCIGFADNPKTILDPFLGSGTTAVAAKQLGRRFLGIEIEERYCAIARERLAQEVLAL